MNKIVFFLAVFLLTGAPAFSQKFFTRDARIDLFSKTSMEDIKAVNKSGTAVVDTKTGNMEWKVLIKNFLFEKALMQEHFNENYLESDKYPSATFKGLISNLSEVNFSKDGAYKTQVKGKMTIHGVEREVTVPGTITVSGKSFKVNTQFPVACADYNIAVPDAVRDKIAKEINITVSATMAPMNN